MYAHESVHEKLKSALKSFYSNQEVVSHSSSPLKSAQAFLASVNERNLNPSELCLSYFGETIKIGSMSVTSSTQLINDFLGFREHDLEMMPSDFLVGEYDLLIARDVVLEAVKDLQRSMEFEIQVAKTPESKFSILFFGAAGALEFQCILLGYEAAGFFVDLDTSLFLDDKCVALISASSLWMRRHWFLPAKRSYSASDLLEVV